MSWCSPKADLETNFLNLESLSSDNLSFSQYELLNIQHSFPTDLFTSYIDLINIH